MSLPVTVGVDGSETAAAAARWAAAHAAASGGAVRLLHVRTPLDRAPLAVRARLTDLELAAVDAMSLIAEALRRDHPGLTVDTAVEEGDIAEVLRRAADRADPLVLGTRGTGVAALALGSVALSVVSLAERPVVLVPPEAAGTPQDREVVVGVDLRGDCGPVLTYGFDEAKSLGVRLRAVHVWRAPGTLSAAVHPGPEQHRHKVEERVLSTELAAVRSSHPDVEAVSEEISGSPAEVLAQAADKASLLVLGHRRRRPAATLGPVVQAAVERAVCPVAVVPHP